MWCGSFIHFLSDLSLSRMSRFPYMRYIVHIRYNLIWYDLNFQVLWVFGHKYKLSIKSVHFKQLLWIYWNKKMFAEVMLFYLFSNKKRQNFELVGYLTVQPKIQQLCCNQVIYAFVLCQVGQAYAKDVSSNYHPAQMAWLLPASKLFACSQIHHYYTVIYQVRTMLPTLWFIHPIGLLWNGLQWVKKTIAEVA